jgi:hypothetical protein
MSILAEENLEKLIKNFIQVVEQMKTAALRSTAEDGGEF